MAGGPLSPHEINNSHLIGMGMEPDEAQILINRHD